MPITVTVRRGVAAIGGLLVIAGLWTLLWPITVTMDVGPFGTSEVSCGSALITNDVYGMLGRAACADSLGDQRSYGWPLVLGGLMLAGVGLLRAPHADSLDAEAGPRYTHMIRSDT